MNKADQNNVKCSGRKNEQSPPDLDEVELVAVVGPRREQHRAVLLVERKISHVDGARAAEDDHRQPRHVTI